MMIAISSDVEYEEKLVAAAQHDWIKRITSVSDNAQAACPEREHLQIGFEKVWMAPIAASHRSLNTRK